MRYNLKTLLEEFVQGLEQSPSCPCASTFSWNQYSYVWNSRHSRSNGRRTSTADKCCKKALKVYVSVTLFAAGETAWDGMFQRKQDKNFFSLFASSSFLLLLPATFSPKQLGMWHDEEITHLRGTFWLVFWLFFSRHFDRLVILHKVVGRKTFLLFQVLDNSTFWVCS